MLRSRSKTVTIGADQPFCIIGERINPTGRKKFAEDLRAGELSTVDPRRAGAGRGRRDMLDVNAGIPLVDEAELLKAMLRTVQDAVDVPICIDSSVIEALEAGLSVYEGRALVNSVTAEDERLEEMLPLVARHDAAVIGLANDETGIPRDAREAARVRAQDRQRRRRLRDQARRRRDRPAGDDRRRRPDGGDDDARDDPPDP